MCTRYPKARTEKDSEEAGSGKSGQLQNSSHPDRRNPDRASWPGESWVKSRGLQISAVGEPERGPGRVFCHCCNMGGKNKKHKTPGAAAVRAAVSASRAKSAEAGAVGEAQSKKPVARQTPTVAPSAREPRVKQGTRRRAAPSYPS